MLSPKQSREFDKFLIEDCGIPGIVLMENAGRNCADLILKEHFRDDRNSQIRATILCGSGNNGGDGFVIARHLVNAGGLVKVVVFNDQDRYSGDSKTMLDCLKSVGQKTIRFSADITNNELQDMIGVVDGKPTNWIVDALLGTGAKGELRTDMASAVEVANALHARRLAVDVPSGLDPATGSPTTTVFRADFCGTFVDIKTGFGHSAAQPFLGATIVLDIGFTPTSCAWSPPLDEALS